MADAALEWAGTMIAIIEAPVGWLLLCNQLGLWSLSVLGLWSLSVAAAHVWSCVQGEKKKVNLFLR